MQMTVQLLWEDKKNTTHEKISINVTKKMSIENIHQINAAK